MKIVFLGENRLWNSMQIVSSDNLHEMRERVFLFFFLRENQKKIFENVVCWFFILHAKRWSRHPPDLTRLFMITFKLYICYFIAQLTFDRTPVLDSTIS